MSATETGGDERPEDAVDARAKELRQGDVFELPDLTFPYVGVLAPAGDDEASFGISLLADTKFVIVSQTCDIVESTSSQPFVKLSPLADVPAHRKGEAARGYVPHLAPIPSLDGFADLRLIATFEKSVVTSAGEPVARLASDEERDLFRGVVHRHFSRAALPDDLTPALAALRKRLRDKKDRDSEEGRAVRAIEEIRISVDPDWDADEMAVTVYLFATEDGYWSLLPEPAADAEKNQWSSDTQASWSEIEKTWLGCCSTTGCITSVDLAVERLAGFDADIYRQAAIWDLGGMSPQPD
jgi:hypothetical protein